MARVEESSTRSTMWPGVRKDSKTSHVRRVDTKAIIWPGVRRGSKTSIVRKVSSGGDRLVEIQLGRTRMRLYANTGSKYTIITPKQYKRSMGKVVEADTMLRAWGSKSHLDVKGMFHTTLSMDRGATTDTWVYVVDGYRPEALLGDRDAEELGIFTFHREGREEVVAGA